MFLAALTRPVMMCTRASNRTPLIPNRVEHAVLPVYDKLLRDDVQDLPVGGHRHMARVGEQALHVGRA